MGDLGGAETRTGQFEDPLDLGARAHESKHRSSSGQLRGLSHFCCNTMAPGTPG
jgi:hypothetical protein